MARARAASGAPAPAGVALAAPRQVPCSFRLLVHEATQVPASCQSLSVAWRKGSKVASTGLAPVQEGRAEWERAISVSCVLLQGAAAQLRPVQFEAKFCWLEVALEDGGTVGHAQLDLADFCDGQVHERVLQVWKSNSSVGGMRLRVSIEACSPAGPAGLGAAAPRAPVLGMLARAQAAPRVAAPVAAAPPPAMAEQAPAAQPAASPAEDLERLIRSGIVRLTTPTPAHGAASTSAASGAGPPSVVPAATASEIASGFQSFSRKVSTVSASGREEGSTDGTLAGVLGTAAADGGRAGTSAATAGTAAASAPLVDAAAAGAGVPAAGGAALPPFTEAASQHATMLRGLPARLVALCNRQCQASGLSSAEQDDALRLLAAALKRAREPLVSCGLLFSAVPAQGVPAAAAAASAVPAVPAAAPALGAPQPPTRSSTFGMGGSPRLLASPQHASLRADASPFRAPSAASSVLGVSLHGASTAVRPPTPTGSPGGPLLTLPPGLPLAGLLGSGFASFASFASAGAPSVGGLTPCGGASVGGASAAATMPGAGGAVAAGAAAADVGQQACTRHIYELLSYLSDIRSLALALEMQHTNEVAELGAPFGAPGAASAGALTTGPAVTAESAARVEAASSVARDSPSPPAETAVAATSEGVGEAATSAAANAEAATEERGGTAASQVIASDGAAGGAVAQARQATGAEDQEVISQIIQGVEQAAVVGGQALDEAGTAFNELFLRLDEVSRDREIWAQRFLAARELQYSAALCDRALRLDAVPAVEAIAVS